MQHGRRIDIPAIAAPCGRPPRAYRLQRRKLKQEIDDRKVPLMGARRSSFPPKMINFTIPATVRAAISAAV